MPALTFTTSVTEPVAASLGLGPPTCRTRDYFLPVGCGEDPAGSALALRISLALGSLFCLGVTVASTAPQIQACSVR